MSKKQNSKKKVSIKLKPQEAYVIAESSWFIAIAETYESLSKIEENKDTKKELLQTAAFIRESVESTYFDSSSDYYDDEDWD
jgi:hypothetical protein